MRGAPCWNPNRCCRRSPRSGRGAREIRVASVAGVARTFLPAAMARFRQDWPDMRFDLHVDTPREVLRRVAEGQAELGMAFNMERAGG